MRGQKKKLRNNPIYHHIKKNKYLGINLPKEKKELYSKNYMMLTKEIKEDTKRWKNKQQQQQQKNRADSHPSQMPIPAED